MKVAPIRALVQEMDIAARIVNSNPSPPHSERSREGKKEGEEVFRGRGEGVISFV